MNIAQKIRSAASENVAKQLSSEIHNKNIIYRQRQFFKFISSPASII